MSQWLEPIWYPSAPPGLPARLALGPLTLASWLFRAGVKLRASAYRHRLFPVHKISGTLVVSIGNLNVGGMGKTPVVIYLAQLCSQRGKKVAVVTRGHGRRGRGEVVLKPGATFSAEAAGDEPLLISQRCPAATVFVGSDRTRLAERARDEAGAEVVLLDDGMQHHRLARDLELVVIDQAAGFGNGRPLPRGPLREPVSAAERADLLWIQRSESADWPILPHQIPQIHAIHSVGSAIAPDRSVLPIPAIADQKLFVFAGIARPRALLENWRQLGLQIRGARFFPDHHFFQPHELDSIKAQAEAAGASILATTEKDRVRLPPDFPAWALRLEVAVVKGMPHLLQAFGFSSTGKEQG
jgi:tetraacyldisaccharide 4'-kinase